MAQHSKCCIVCGNQNLKEKWPSWSRPRQRNDNNGWPLVSPFVRFTSSAIRMFHFPGLSPTELPVVTWIDFCLSLSNHTWCCRLLIKVFNSVCAQNRHMIDSFFQPISSSARYIMIVMPSHWISRLVQIENVFITFDCEMSSFWIEQIRFICNTIQSTCSNANAFYFVLLRSPIHTFLFCFVQVTCFANQHAQFKLDDGLRI